MRYRLKFKDIDVMIFDLDKSLDGVIVSNIEILNNKKIPLDLDVNNIDKWLKRRIIPSNRAYVNNFLAKQGLNEKDIIGIINISKSLSLNDCYWVVPANFKGEFSEFNLYNNKFSNILSSIAFTGYGSEVRTTFRTSPEFTTNGMLAKCWRRVDGEILLFKSGTEGAANTGKEPYSEFLAYQIAEAMGINSIPYNLSKWKNKLCSTCKLFTSINESFIPTGSIVKQGGINAVLEYYKNLGEEFYSELITMFLFDAIIFNTDRHLGNFGFIIDNNTNEIVRTAPIFDNGLSLFCYSMDETFEEMSNYSKTRTPALYDNYIDILNGQLTSKNKEQLRNLIGFKFRAHPRYNLDKKRLKLIEKAITERVAELLGL